MTAPTVKRRINRVNLKTRDAILAAAALLAVSALPVSAQLAPAQMPGMPTPNAATPNMPMNHAMPGKVIGNCVPGTSPYGLFSTDAQSMVPDAEHTRGTFA